LTPGRADALIPQRRLASQWKPLRATTTLAASVTISLLGGATRERGAFVMGLERRQRRCPLHRPAGYVWLERLLVAVRPRRGLVLVYYGQGKGKTTAALGLAMRALGRGWRVCMLQFTKSGEWPPGKPVGETVGATRLAPEFELLATGLGFVNILGDPFPFEAHREAAERGLALAHEKLRSDTYDLVILDEIIGAISQRQLELEAVLEVVRHRPRRVSMLLTGHDDREEFINRLLEVADLATEMRKVKHPFDAGRQAVKGLDY
jgi:cob(I)alamin adenosyltransferase